MAIRCYRPAIERVQEEYSAEVARRFLQARRGRTPSVSRIVSNSEPWIAEPKTIDDLWAIAQAVQQRVDEFLAWRQDFKSS